MSTVGARSAATPGRGGDTAGRAGTAGTVDAAASRSSAGAGSSGSGSSSDDAVADGGGGGGGASKYSISARAVIPKQSRDGTCRSDDGGGHDSRGGTKAR